MRRVILLALGLLLSACAPAPEVARQTALGGTGFALPAAKRFAGAAAPVLTPISNVDLARDFLDLAFELESGRPIDRFTRVDGPITVRVTGQPPPSLRADLASLVARLRSEAGLDVRRTDARDAVVTIEAVPRAEIRRALPEAACFVVPNVASLSEFRANTRAPRTRWSQLQARTRIAVFLPADASPQEARDCLHEELAQALGPLNDLYRLPESVFNDDNFHTVLTAYDMLILRVHYDAGLQTGMSRAQVARRLPAILARLNPGGEAVQPRALPRTPRAWIQAMHTALGPGAGPAERRRAARDAVSIARAEGWTDHRRGFAHFAMARLMQPVDAAAAEAGFETAGRYFGTAPATAPHRAHVDAQLAAHALTRGDAARAEALVTPQLATAARAENAALLASLMLLRAEALDMSGRRSEARAVRLDSLGWARYGFGPDWAVHAKVREIGALSPRSARPQTVLGMGERG